MTFDKTITIKMSEKELKELIMDHLIDKGYAVRRENINMTYHSGVFGGKFITCTVNIKE